MAKAQILIVEDEAIVAIDIQKTVQTLGYDVPAIAFSGEEALQKTEELHPDVVLMDIVLRGQMDGIEAAQEIYERFGIPIVYLTAYMDEERLTRAQRIGPCFFCIKPFDEGELASTIERVLEGR
jgi:CheY-like chemotaxis protein